MRILLAAAACALAVTACGGNASTVGLTGASASPGATGAAAQSAASGTAPPTAHAAANGVTAGGGTGAASPATPRTSATPGGITLTLGAACVIPGGRQSLTITTGAPSSVSYDTRYADGSLGGTYGGAGISRTAADGTYRTAWTVSTAAPAGTATVSAGASRNGYLRTAAPATFTVAAHC